MEIKDRVARGDNKYIIRDLDDGTGRKELIPSPDEVIEAGTPVNKELLQPLFDGLGKLDEVDQLVDQGKQQIQQATDTSVARIEAAQPIQLANNLTTQTTGWGLDAVQGAVLKQMIDNIPKTPINNTLNSTSTNEALSAAQGKILNETKLGKSEKAADSNLLDGHDSTYFATAAATQNAQNTADRAVSAASAANRVANEGLKVAASAHQAANAAQGRADNAYQRAEQAFTSASNGKLLIANTLTGKGVPTSTTASWQTISENINRLSFFTFTKQQNEYLTFNFNNSSWEDVTVNIPRDSLIFYQYEKGEYWSSERLHTEIQQNGMSVNTVPLFSGYLSQESGQESRKARLIRLNKGTYTVRLRADSPLHNQESILFTIIN